jgi:hypothetical protein
MVDEDGKLSPDSDTLSATGATEEGEVVGDSYGASVSDS